MLLMSDVHFGAHDPSHTDSILDFLRRNPGEVLVLAGDLVKFFPTDEHFRLAGQFLKHAIANGARVVCTPGNHDMDPFLGWLGLKSKRARDLFREHIMEPLSDQKNIDMDLEDLNMALFTDTDAFFALRSSHMMAFGRAPSRITKKQIRWTASIVGRVGDRRLHLVTHHSLWKDDLGPTCSAEMRDFARAATEGKGDKHNPLHQRKRLEKHLLAEFRFSSFIHGHNHIAKSAMRATPKIGYRIRHISIPTAAFRKVRGEGPAIYLWDGDPAHDPNLMELPLN